MGKTEGEKKVKELAKWLDDQIDFKEKIGGVAGQIAEAIDGSFFNLSLQFGFSKLSEADQISAIQIFDWVIAGDYEEIATQATSLIVTKIKTKLGDDVESIIINGIWGIALDIIKAKAVA